MRAVFSEFIDYAGLFPPAACTMADAVRNYDAYLRSPDEWLLGRFVVAASRLPELADTLASTGIRAGAGRPWRLSVVLGANIPEALGQIEAFAARPETAAIVVDSVEYKVQSGGQVAAVAGELPASLLRFLEVPFEGPYGQLLAAIGQAGAFAKIRTGGTTPGLFPATDQLAAFLLAATRHGVPFKATAGLHHPFRGRYPLTYDPDPEFHLMYGYVNLLLATAEAARSGDGEIAEAILDDRDPANFELTGAGLRWRDRHYLQEELAHVRAHCFLGFGSCSFREPVDELRLGEVR